MDKNYIVKGTLSNPIVFNAIFQEPKFCAILLNSIGLFNIDVGTIRIESTKFYGGVDLKSADMDVTIKIEDATYIDLELQKNKTKYDMLARLNYYLSLLTSSSQARGKGYRKTYSVIFAIFGYNIFQDEGYMREFVFSDGHGNIIEYSKLVIIELSKKDKCDRIELRKWIDTFNEHDLNSIKDGNGIMSEVAKKIVALNADEQLQAYFRNQERKERDAIATIEAEREEAMAEGLLAGKLETAKKLKELGASIEMIIEATGLDLEIIEKL